jgi:hypothetical protein
MQLPGIHRAGGPLMWEFVVLVLLFWAIILWIFALFSSK